MILNINCQECGAIVETYRNPFPTTDIVLLREGKVLLIKRKNPPAGWALPGGFIDYGETAEAAAVREAYEETGLKISDLILIGVYSDPKRDPRFHTLTVAYAATATGEPTAGDDALEAKWFLLSNLPDPICFDHRTIIQDTVIRTGLNQP